jgi:hypothetical protein
VCTATLVQYNHDEGPLNRIAPDVDTAHTLVHAIEATANCAAEMLREGLGELGISTAVVSELQT